MKTIMLATVATHVLGDLSRKYPDYCVIDSAKETPLAYVGNWLSGLGYLDVHFPKTTTRRLTEEEKKKLPAELQSMT